MPLSWSPNRLMPRIQALLGENLAETYPARSNPPCATGWDDPAMDEYNDYDRHRSS